MTPPGRAAATAREDEMRQRNESDGGAGVTRRDFFLGSAAAMTPLVLARRVGAAPIDDVIKVGLVGCGGRGTGAAAQALQAPGNQVLTAVADVFADKCERTLKNLAAHLGESAADRLRVDEAHRFVGFDAYEKLLATDIDVVVLATPPHFRPAMLKAAIEAGKHVFCEKPVAVDAPGARSVLETVAVAREKKLSLVCGFCWRYNVKHRAFYEQLHAGRLGDVRAFYSTYNASPLRTSKRDPSWSEMEFQLRNWQHFNWLSGDHVVEQAVHSLDKQAWTFGDAPPESCVAVGGRQARFGEETGNIYDHFGVTFDYAGGKKAFHMCRQMANCATENNDYWYGSKGNGVINGWANRFTIDGETPWEYEGEGNDMYQQEHDELFQSIRGEGPYKNDGVWMTTSTMLAIMARMAAYTGQVITWDRAMASEERLGPDRYEWGDLAAKDVPVPGRTKFV